MKCPTNRKASNQTIEVSNESGGVSNQINKVSNERGEVSNQIHEASNQPESVQPNYRSVQRARWSLQPNQSTLQPTQSTLQQNRTHNPTKTPAKVPPWLGFHLISSMKIHQIILTIFNTDHKLIRSRWRIRRNRRSNNLLSFNF